ncbi:hypothetical protein B0H14DRAFT_3534914 [Mycena olivaceomarginata]|nr:hypothetical protein B0H14DRAFT_3534914 [Mycena olivaceomarginata]
MLNFSSTVTTAIFIPLPLSFHIAPVTPILYLHTFATSGTARANASTANAPSPICCRGRAATSSTRASQLSCLRAPCSSLLNSRAWPHAQHDTCLHRHPQHMQPALPIAHIAFAASPHTTTTPARRRSHLPSTTIDAAAPHMPDARRPKLGSWRPAGKKRSCRNPVFTSLSHNTPTALLRTSSMTMNSLRILHPHCFHAHSIAPVTTFHFSLPCRPDPSTLPNDAFPPHNVFVVAIALPSLAVNLHPPTFTSPNHPQRCLSRYSRVPGHKGRRAFITTMGFDVATFDLILGAGFDDAWNTTPIPREDVPGTGKTRPGARSLDAPGALGLLLHYLNSTMREISLQQIFALIPSTISRYITFGLGLLLQILCRMPQARIQWPQQNDERDEFAEYNELIVARHPLLDGAFASLDGLNLLCQTSDDMEIENATYNGKQKPLKGMACIFKERSTGNHEPVPGGD